jgi:hypothetical protein
MSEFESPSVKGVDTVPNFASRLVEEHPSPVSCSCRESEVFATCKILLTRRSHGALLTAHTLEHNKILRLKAAGLCRFAAWRKRTAPRVIVEAPTTAHVEPQLRAATGTIQIQVRMCISRCEHLCLDVVPADLIGTIKKKLIPTRSCPDDVYMTKGSKVLPDMSTVSDCKLEHGCVIELCGRMRAGHQCLECHRTLHSGSIHICPRNIGHFFCSQRCSNIHRCLPVADSGDSKDFHSDAGVAQADDSDDSENEANDSELQRALAMSLQFILACPFHGYLGVSCTFTSTEAHSMCAHLNRHRDLLNLDMSDNRNQIINRALALMVNARFCDTCSTFISDTSQDDHSRSCAGAARDALPKSASCLRVDRLGVTATDLALGDAKSMFDIRGRQFRREEFGSVIDVNGTSRTQCCFFLAALHQSLVGRIVGSEPQQTPEQRTRRLGAIRGVLSRDAAALRESLVPLANLLARERGVRADFAAFGCPADEYMLMAYAILIGDLTVVSRNRSLGAHLIEPWIATRYSFPGRPGDAKPEMSMFCDDGHYQALVSVNATQPCSCGIRSLGHSTQFNKTCMICDSHLHWNHPACLESTYVLPIPRVSTALDKLCRTCGNHFAVLCVLVSPIT